MLRPKLSIRIKHAIALVLAVQIWLFAQPVGASSQDLVLNPIDPSDRVRMERFARQVPATPGLRVFWWNIANGGSEADVESLTKNLEILATSDLQPHVIALGEFSKTSLSLQTLAVLMREYPHAKIIPYNRSTKVGIAVFSKIPYSIVRGASLTWIPGGLSEAEQKAYRNYWAKGHKDGGEGFYSRPVREISMQLGRSTLSFTPIHLAQPWRELGKRSDGKIDFALVTARELFFGTKNPLITQVNSLLTWLKPAGKNRLLVGDFNLPRSFFGLTTLGFRSLDRVLDSAIVRSEPSFPTPGSPHTYPAMQIDHAFVSGAVTAPLADVLPLKGSDHFPVYILVR